MSGSQSGALHHLPNRKKLSSSAEHRNQKNKEPIMGICAMNKITAIANIDCITIGAVIITFCLIMLFMTLLVKKAVDPSSDLMPWVSIAAMLVLIGGLILASVDPCA